MNAKRHHSLLTDEAMQSCSENARKAIGEAGNWLLSLSDRAERRFNGGRTDAERQAMAELRALANHAIAMLARFDHAMPKLKAALAEDN